MTSPSLQVSAVRGVLWTGGGQAIRQIAAFATALAMARILTPADFGMLALIVIAVELAQLFADFGVGSAIVQRQQVDGRVLSTLFWINTAVSALCAVLLILAAPLMAGWFREPRLTSILAVAALNVLVCGAMVTPQAILMMRMSFREIMFAQTVGSLCASATALTMATAGMGVWALAVQPLVGSLITMVLLFRQCGWFPKFVISWREARGTLGFSATLLLSSFMSYMTRNLWGVVLGRSLGTQQVGVFNLSQQIVTMPMLQFASVLVRVLFPALSQLQTEPERFAQAWIRSISVIGLVIFPLLFGLWVLVPDFVPVVLGPQWTEAIGPMRILVVAALIQSAGTTASTVLMSMGRGRDLIVLSFGSLVLMAIALLIGQSHGLMGVCIAYLAATAPAYLSNIVLACRSARINSSRMTAALFPAVACSLIMAFGVWLTLIRLSDWSQLARLLVGIGAGILLYGASTALINRETVQYLWLSLRSARKS